MYCKSFWKKLLTFCLTFWFGVFTSYFFISKESLSENGKIAALISKQKQCVFADKNLKYQTLPLEEAIPFMLEEKEWELIIIPNEEEPKIKISKDKQLDTTDIQKNQKYNSEPKPQLYNPSKDEIQPQTLLHKENCYESDERK